MNANWNMKRLSLQEIQSIELNILKCFSKYCNDNNLRYSLAYGSMIGAVRHHGFIPWDDDIDVFMPRNDYEYFLTNYQSEQYEILKLGRSNYYYPFAKLCDNSTIAKMENNLTDHGVWVDIFPVDKVPDDQIKAIKFQKSFIRKRDIVIANTTDFKHSKVDIKFIAKLVLSMNGKLFGLESLPKKMESDALKYNNTSNERLASVVWQSVINGFMTIADFNNAIDIDFEDCKFKIIQNYDKFLKQVYGDYMVMPDAKHRQSHYLIAYRR